MYTYINTLFYIYRYSSSIRKPSIGKHIYCRPSAVRCLQSLWQRKCTIILWMLKSNLYKKNMVEFSLVFDLFSRNTRCFNVFMWHCKTAGNECSIENIHCKHGPLRDTAQTGFPCGQALKHLFHVAGLFHEKLLHRSGL